MALPAARTRSSARQQKHVREPPSVCRQRRQPLRPEPDSAVQQGEAGARPASHRIHTCVRGGRTTRQLRRWTRAAGRRTPGRRPEAVPRSRSARTGSGRRISSRFPCAFILPGPVGRRWPAPSSILDGAVEIRQPWLMLSARGLRVDDDHVAARRLGVPPELRVIRHGVAQVAVLQSPVPRGDDGTVPRHALEEAERIVLERDVEQKLDVVEQDQRRRPCPPPRPADRATGAPALAR